MESFVKFITLLKGIFAVVLVGAIFYAVIIELLIYSDYREEIAYLSTFFSCLFSAICAFFAFKACQEAHEIQKGNIPNFQQQSCEMRKNRRNHLRSERSLKKQAFSTQIIRRASVKKRSRKVNTPNGD